MANINSPEMSGENFENRIDEGGDGKLEELKQKVGKKTAMALLALNVGVTAGANNVQAEEPKKSEKSEKSVDELLGSVEIEEEDAEKAVEKAEEQAKEELRKELERKARLLEKKQELAERKQELQEEKEKLMEKKEKREEAEEIKRSDNKRIKRMREILEGGMSSLKENKEELQQIVDTLKSNLDEYSYARTEEDEEYAREVLNEVKGLL